MIKKMVLREPVTRSPVAFPQQQSHKASIGEEEIRELFWRGKRDVLELDYLYHSPLFSQSPPYRELVQVLEHYNKQAQQFNQGNSVVENNKDPSRVRLAVIKLLYREMMCLAIKQEIQIKNSDQPAKLRDWYYGLEDMHSFLQCLHIKKKDPPENNFQDSLIRASYSSNVFDEIDDYLRRKVDTFVAPRVASPTPSRFPAPKHSIPCNLPLIDRLLYKRADLRMREHREQEFEKQLLQTMSSNKSKMREMSLTKLNDKGRFKNNVKGLDKQNSVHQDMGYLTMPGHLHPRGSQNVSPKRRICVKERQLNRLSLNSINGINLIQNPLE